MRAEKRKGAPAGRPDALSDFFQTNRQAQPSDRTTQSKHTSEYCKAHNALFCKTEAPAVVRRPPMDRVSGGASAPQADEGTSPAAVTILRALNRKVLAKRYS